MAIPNNFHPVLSPWLNERLDGGEAEVFHEEVFRTEIVPHCTKLEDEFLRMYVYAPDNNISDETISDLRSFASNIVSDNNDNQIGLVGRIVDAIATNHDDTEDDEVELDYPGTHDVRIPTITFEIVSDKEISSDDKGKLENLLSAPLVYSNNGYDTVLWPQTNFHCTRRTLDSLRYLNVPMNFMDLLSNNSQRRFLGFVLISFGDLYHNVIRPQEEKIYSSNVRSFLGRTITNNRLEASYKQIVQSGLDSEVFSLFPFRNNGITISCRAIIPAALNGSIGLQDPKIINGQQTARTWEKVYTKLTNQESREKLEKVIVVVKFVQLPDDNLVREIAFANNRQNPVSADVLRSNEPVLVRIDDVWSLRQPLVPFLRKGSKGGNWISPRRIYEMDYYFNHGYRCSRNASEVFFDDGDDFNDFFCKFENRLKENGYQQKFCSLYLAWKWMTTNHTKTNRTRKKIIVRAFGLDLRQNPARHPFFDVGAVGWRILVTIFSHALLNAKIDLAAYEWNIAPQVTKNLQSIAENFRDAGRLNGVAEQMMQSLNNFVEEYEVEEDEEKLDPLDADTWKLWLNEDNDRYREFLNVARLNAVGIV